MTQVSPIHFCFSSADDGEGGVATKQNLAHILYACALEITWSQNDEMGTS